MCCVKMKGIFMSSAHVQGLARNGIIHFDPDAYIRDGVAHYVEQDDGYLPFDRPLYATPFPLGYRVPVMYEQPHKDVYVRHEKHSSSWAGPIIGAIIGALGVYLGYQFFKDKNETVLNPDGTKAEVKRDVKAEAKATGEKVKEGAKGFFEDAKDVAKETKDKVVGWFKGRKVESDIDKVINEASRNPASVQKGYFKTRFQKTKIALGIAAAATVLYTVYKFLTGRSHNAPAPSNGGGH